MKKDKKRMKPKIKTLDDVRDISLKIVDILVAEKYVKNCMDTDDDTEFAIQDIITDVLCRRLKIKND